MGKKSDRLKFSGKALEYYNALMKVRAQVVEQMNYCAEDALNVEHAAKRGVNTHMADVAGDSVRHEMELRMLDEDGDILSLIDDAVERLANGEFGKCQECGEPISEARLSVRPYAVFCIRCKSRHEEMMKN